MPFRLQCKVGGRVVSHVLARGETDLGAGAACAVRVPDPTVSRRHARFRVDGERVFVCDLGSRNGTRIDGRSIGAETELPVGATVMFGSLEARLDRVDADELDAAILFPAASPPAEPAARRATGFPTATLGSFDGFVANLLPDVLRRIAGTASPVEIAHQIGAFIFQQVPCLAVEIVRSGTKPGTLFQASRSPDVGTEMCARAGRYDVRVGFADSGHADTFRPLVENAAWLVFLAQHPLVPLPPAGPRTPRPPDPPSVVGEVARVYADAARVARGQVSVLILGESGTGKELLARFIHEASPLAEKPFIALNCAALPRDLLEAELFGIEKGVATGVEARPGRFESAHGGTLFLDEIGDMSQETQARILRVLQEGTVYRLGGREARPARVRTLSATNCDLRAMLAGGHFRQDLFHRIADWTVSLPPLRRRRADIPNLAAHFLAREGARRGVAVGGISRAALDALIGFDWPGNIRQLEREMARAALFVEDGALLESSHLDDAIACRPRPSARVRLRERLDEFERIEIERELQGCAFDTAAAAERLGVPRSTLYRRIKDLGIATGQ